MDIKEEDPMSDDDVPQNQTEQFTKHLLKEIKTEIATCSNWEKNSNTEVKSETPFTKHLLKEIKTEIATCSKWEKDSKADIEEQTLISEFGPRNEREFLPENPLLKTRKSHNDHAINEGTEIKSETPFTKDLLMQIKTESVPRSYHDTKDVDFPPVKSSRLCREAVSDASSNEPSLSSTEVPGSETDLYNRKDHIKSQSKKSNVTEMSTTEEHTLLEQSVKYSEGGETYIRPLQLKQKSLIHKDNKRHKCNICHKSFTQIGDLNRHNLIHEGKKPHQCKTCDRSFTQLSHLKTHNFIHEGKKPHECKTCDRSFTQLSHLKTHNLIHEGKKPHQCKTCDKSFTQLSHLKTHSFIHVSKKPHKCKNCDKSFALLSHLKTHNLTHEGKKPHQCKTCEKSFTQIGDLKRHNLIHEGKKPHECKTCDKSFTQLSHLKTHNLIHERKK